MVEQMPTSSVAGVKSARGTYTRAARMALARKPDFSATATPTEAVSTRPRGGKRTKIDTRSVASQRKPSAESRLRAVSTRPAPFEEGTVQDQPAFAANHEIRN